MKLSSATVGAAERDGLPAWRATLARYQRPSRVRALWQVVDTLGSYAAVWWLMYVASRVSWWLALPLAVLAGGLLVRVFIIFHDCSHGSFLRSRRACDALGFVCGVLTFTPFREWQGEHAMHHRTSGDLDRRGIGDIWTMTVEEYLTSSRRKRFAYRLARNPLVLLTVAPLYLFLVRQRVPKGRSTKRERRSVWWTNLAIAVQILVLGRIFGPLPYALLQLCVIQVAGCAGVWLFYVQHQFEGTYWRRGSDWSFGEAALQGSSFYQLPRVLQWFSGNIGFHHVHHLSPRIPNYHLERCHRSISQFRRVRPMTLRASVRSLSLRLWDESREELVGFSRGRARRACGRRSSSSTSGGTPTTWRV